MPLQNRVNPFGELIATPARGTLMGNRGRLHDEHLRKRTHPAELADLPAGVMVLLEGDERPWLVLADVLRPWTADGYGPAVPRPAGAAVRLLTPPSVVRAIAKGFPVGKADSCGSRGG